MSRLDSELKITSNNLADIIGWLKDGDFVFIHNKYQGGRFFHKCNGVSENFAELVANTRVIYVDVSSHSNLLVDGEWNWYIENAGFKECNCGLREFVSVLKQVPHRRQLSLGY